MTQKVVTSKNDKNTEKLGEEFADKLKPSDVILLHGELGAGKTTFVKGVAKGLGITTRVISPTFVLIRSHVGQLKHANVTLNHVDLYRVTSEDDIAKLGLDEVFEDHDAITIIEWGNRTKKIKYTWEIVLEVIDEKKRKITIVHK